MDYGKALRVSRALSGIQQKDLAEQADLDASYISLIEKGRRKPSRKAINAISKALGMPPSLFTLLAAEQDDISLVEPVELERVRASLAELLFFSKRTSNET